MSFLDRLRPNPKWKHADPVVRAAAVAEIPDDAEHRPILAELAGSDDDVRVRRAAVVRVDAVAELVALARSERDEDLRREIAERLVAIATTPREADGDAALALDGLGDARQLAAVAKASPYDTVRTAALGRISDVKALGSVARHAADGQTALEAVGRIADVPELVNIALKTEHKDAGVSALERAVETTPPGTPVRDLLENAAARAKSKAVVKRARGMIQALDEAAAAQRAALEAWQQRLAAVMARLEAVAAAPGPDSDRELGDAESEWRNLAGTTGFEMDQDAVARFGAFVAEARTAIDRRHREEAERRAEAERQAAIRTVRLSLCDRVEALRGDTAADDVAKARAEWEGLPGPGEQEIEDAELRARFEAACRRAIERQQNQVEIQKHQARLAELATEAERLASEPEIPEHSWNAVASEWRGLLPKGDDVPADVTEQFARAEATVKAREEERRATAERLLKQQLQRLDQLIDRAQKRAAAEDLTLREADRAARDLRAALDSPPQLSYAVQGFDEREQHALVERLRGAIAELAPRLHELREMDEWKRFANAAVQEELIAKTEALRVRFGFDSPDGPKPDDVEKAARELHEIQERWKQVAEAPRAQAQALWHRYRLAADPIQAKAREFFAQRAEERSGNLQRKLALIERAEALADSTDWIKTADELKKLQAEWQQIGPVPRQDTKVTWKRFRDACDRFFSRRNSDLAERKEAWAANLAKKEVLCARAEALAASREWEKAAAEIRRLQAEWKTVGPVRRNKSEAIWARFRSACDTFFERYKRRDEIELEAKQADREALVNEIASLAPASPTGDAPQEGTAEPAAPPSDLLERVRSLRSRWNQTTPVVRHGADPLSSQFVTALERVITSYPESFRGTELDTEANRQRMEKLCARVEAFVTDQPSTPAGSSKALAEMLREALASNTIGGRASEESKWRAMAEEVRQAQSSWSRLGPVPGDAGRELTERFHRACNRFFDQYRRRVPQQAQQRGSRPPVGAR
jgi:hypothetical protein